MKKVLFVFYFTVFSFSYGFENCLKFFKQEKYLRAEKCFSHISSKNSLYPYSLYYGILAKSLLEENFTEEIKDMENYRKTAVYSYTYLFLSSFYRFKDPQKAFKFWKRIDYRALSPDELPFYYYLKADILKRLGKNPQETVKKIITAFPYDRTYGYPVLIKNLKKLSEKELFQAVDKLSSKRMYKRALNILFFAKNSEKKYLYLSILYGKLRQFDKATYYLLKIKSKKLRGKASYVLLRLNPEYSLQNAYFQILKGTNISRYIEKAADYIMKRSFYKNKYREFFHFADFITEKSRYYSDKIWYRFLYLYQKDRKKKAAKILEKNIRYFDNRAKVYYWLYLSYKGLDRKKAIYYLKKASEIKKIDFYTLRAREKLKRRRFPILRSKDPKIDEKALKMIKKLKKISYKNAYIEAKYYLKLGSKEKLSSVFPELTARYFLDKKSISKLSYPKPFYKIEKKNLIYAFMRRESFFDVYAISPSNAVGLMQIIPSTARWIAKETGDKKFDITDLFIPEKNIKYGRWYINYLKKIFKGNIFYVMAAYNAGPNNVRKVLKKNRIKNIEEFVEYFPFRETRYYIKYVYTNFRAYQELYGER